MIYVAVMGFNNPKVIHETLERFQNLTDTEGLELVKVFYDCQYPLPDKVANKAEYKKSCDQYGFEYKVLEKNFGQDGNINKIFEDLKPQKDDYLLFWDPDNYPQNSKYLKDALTHMKCHPEVGYCTLWREHPMFDMRQTQGVLISEIPRFRYIIGGPGGWPMALWSGDFIATSGGIVQTHSYYGATENNILIALQKNRFCGTMLEDHQDLMTSVGHDQAYILWKHQVISLPEHPDFEEFLTGLNVLEVFGRGKNLT